MNEFELIRHYFTSSSFHRSDVVLGIGDDCAILAPKANHQLVVTTDTMVDGIHFDGRLTPFDIGHKLMAVNLSDLASMGAEPCWVSLALTLPKADKNWLAEFSSGLVAMAKQYEVSLIGGDTTRGALTLSLTAQGQLPVGKALRRDGAQAGDLVFVSGHLGDAALALKQAKIAQLPEGELQALEARLFRPTPRVKLGGAIRELASSCIDLSDGLAVDLGHILKRSGVAAQIEADKVPVSVIAQSLLGEKGAAQQALSGGDDYELCFTAPKILAKSIAQAAQTTNTPVTCIGEIHQGAGLAFTYRGTAMDWHPEGFMHFK